MAACTAHPGSLPWVQLVNRQRAANASISEKVCEIPSFASQSCNSRSPGVSMSKAPPGRGKQLPRGRCMPSPAVRCAYLRDFLEVTPQQAVNDRGLSYPRGTQQDQRLSPAQVPQQFFEALSGLCADCTRRDAPSNFLNFVYFFFKTLAGIRLVQDDHGLRARLPALHEIPLDAPGVEITVER